MGIEKNTKNTLVHESSGFTTIINDTINTIRDQGALGIYCYLASKPEGWNICKKHLQNHFQCGRDKINSNFSYLKKIGAIEIKSIRDEAGVIVSWTTTLKRRLYPQANNIHNTTSQYSGNLPINPAPSLDCIQITGKPHSGKTAPINKDILQNKEVNKRNKIKKNPVFVFLKKEEVKDHVKKVIEKRELSLTAELIEQIVFYIMMDKNPNILLATKKTNIALKKIQQRTWNTPSGYNGISLKEVAAKEKTDELVKQEQYARDAKVSRTLTRAVLSGKGKEELNKILTMLH